MNLKYNKQKVYIAVLLLAAAVVFSATASGCGIIRDFLNDSLTSLEQDTTAAATEPKPTAPIKTINKTLYGYDYITDEDVKILYGLIDEYAQNCSSDIFATEGELSYRQITEGITAYQNDHPEVFWLDGNCYYYCQDGYTYITLIYTMDADTCEQAKLNFESKVDEILQNAPLDASPFELELYVHDYIIENCEYDYEAADAVINDDDIDGNFSNAYGALVESKAVCGGYTMAFNLLCNSLGIDCINVSGKGESENHIWNCVQLDGEWYYVDVTWDDVDSEDEENSELYQYIYFNVNDDVIQQNHIIGGIFEEMTDEEYEATKIIPNLFVPECTATKYGYYLYEGVILSDLYDSSEIVSAIAEAAKDNKQYFYITLDSSLDFDSISDQILYDGYLAEWIGTANLTNLYSVTLEDEAYVYTLKKRNLLIVELEYI